MTTPTPETPDELLAKCDRILDFEDGDARSFTVQFAEEVKAVVVPLRERLAEVERARRTAEVAAGVYRNSDAALRTRLAEVENLLAYAAAALRGVDREAFGIGGRGMTHWYLVDELLSHIDAALAHDKEDV